MSLYENINRRKKAGTSRSKKKSTITKKAYANMKAGFPKKKKKKQELIMPKGKGTYGSKVGRPPKKKSTKKSKKK